MARNNEFIEERKDSYRVHIPYYDVLGKRSFYSKTFSIKKYGSRQKALEMAKKHRDEIKVKIANAMIIRRDSITFEQIYKKTMDLHQCSISTRRKYDSNFNNHFANVIDINQDFKNIRFDMIQQQLNSMVSDCSQDMIKRAYAIWQMCYKYAIADDYVMKDETLKVIVPKSELIIKKKDQTASYSQVIRIIELIEKNIKNPRNRMLYKSALLIMLYTGMRPSEVFALEDKAVNLQERTINIYQRTGSSSKERHTIVKVKTDSSERIIHYRSELDKTMADLVYNSVNGYLFTKQNGKLMNGDEFSDRINKISDGTFHAYALRHQFTTDLLLQDIDQRTIMELMGHSEKTMTLYYARSNEEKKKEAIEKRVINDVKKA